MPMGIKVAPLLRRVLETGQRLGVNITANHYYSDIPDFRALRRETWWRKPWSMEGVAGADVERQLEFAHGCAAGLAGALTAPGESVFEEAVRRNGEPGYGPTEAEFLYCFVRSKTPRRIVQVGCGVSTAVILRAARDHGAENNGGYSPRITCVEPYPTALLNEEAAAGRIDLREEPAQRTPLETFTSLEPGDLLFVDSTHTLRPGSEVTRLVFEALPRLAPGVFVHFHDIYFPYDYPPQLLTDGLFFWHETALLYGFLLMNPSYCVRVSLAMLHNTRADALRRIMPNYRPAPTRDGLADGPLDGHFPSSIYLERTA